MPLVLYGKPISPPVRNVIMLCAHMGLEYELRQIDTARGDHLKPEFIRINPQHTIPVLKDDGAILIDSHSIMAYLVGKYGKPEHDSLYPKDLIKRAMVDARLHFDTGLAHNSLKTCLTRGLTDVHKALITEVYEILNQFLEHQPYVAGDTVTIADICLISTIKSLDVIIPIHRGGTYPYTYMYRWISDMEKFPFMETMKPGLQAFKEYVMPIFCSAPCSIKTNRR